jgi:predicted AAA+ superfamily ATPase
LWDWARIENRTARFENLVAVHLLRFANWCQGVEGANVDVRFFRNVVGKEVDFLVTNDRHPGSPSKSSNQSVCLTMASRNSSSESRSLSRSRSALTAGRTSALPT